MQQKPKRNEILVVGSINMDIVVDVPVAPGAGETVLAKDLHTYPGGKGANQAVAAARLGGVVHMCGCLGDDPSGRELLEGLRKDGVHTDFVKITPDAPSGTAVIWVEPHGENRIVVVPGANQQVTPEAAKAAIAALADRLAAVLVQLEIPMETVTAAVAEASRLGIPVLFDPAPAPSAPLPAELLRQIAILAPNQHEAAALTGRPVVDAKAARLAASQLLDQGCASVIIKLGGEGALVMEGQQGHSAPGDATLIPAISVKVVDSTAAGDCFAGALAVALSEGRPLREAVQWANAAAALSVTRPGAQSSLPRREEVDALLSNKVPGKR